MTADSHDRDDDVPRTLHDGFFKHVFSDPALAADELCAVLPPALVASIDWPALRPAPASFVDAVFRQRSADLVFQGRFLAGGEVLLWFLLEHQSWPWRVRHPHRMKPRRVRGRGDTGGARTEEVGLNGWPARGRYVTWCHEPVPELDREPHEHPILLPCGPRPREHAL